MELLSIRIMLVCRSVIINDVEADDRRFRAYKRLAAQHAQHRWRSSVDCPTNYVCNPEHQKPTGYIDERREGVRTYFMLGIGRRRLRNISGVSPEGDIPLLYMPP